MFNVQSPALRPGFARPRIIDPRFPELQAVSDRLAALDARADVLNANLTFLRLRAQEASSGPQAAALRLRIQAMEQAQGVLAAQRQVLADRRTGMVSDIRVKR